MSAETKNVYESYLDIKSPYLVTEGVEFIEYRDISAQKEQLNGESRSITFNIDYTDDYTLLQKSYFILDVDLMKTDGNRYANTAEIALSNNGLMYLFNRVEYAIEGAVIEAFNDPGITTTVDGMLKYDQTTSESIGGDFGWVLDTYDYAAKGADNNAFKVRSELILKTDTTIGHYRYIIPFTHIFGSSNKILRAAKLKITFLRSSSLDSNAIYKSSAQTSGADNVDNGKIVINDFIMMVAVPKLNESLHAQITSYLAEKPKIPYQFPIKHIESKEVATGKYFNWNLSFPSKDRKLYGAAIIFQTDRNGDQKKNISVFDNLKVEHAELQMNGITYPGTVLNALDIKTYTDLYHRFVEFRKLFSSGHPEINSKEFRTAFPMYCFNLMLQKTKILNDPYNIGLRFKFHANAPANTTCYCIFFLERYITLTTFGDHKMTPMIL